MKYVAALVTAFSCLLLASCTSVPENPRKVDALPAIYPDYIGVTIPEEIAPLNFSLMNEAVDMVDVVVRGSKGGEIHVQGRYADFDISDWHQLAAQNTRRKRRA